MSKKLTPLTRQQNREVMANPVSCLRCRRAYETLFNETIPPNDPQWGFGRIAEHFDSIYEAYKYCLTMSNDPEAKVTPFEK